MRGDGPAAQVMGSGCEKQRLAGVGRELRDPLAGELRVGQLLGSRASAHVEPVGVIGIGGVDGRQRPGQSLRVGVGVGCRHASRSGGSVAGERRIDAVDPGQDSTPHVPGVGKARVAQHLNRLGPPRHPSCSAPPRACSCRARRASRAACPGESGLRSGGRCRIRFCSRTSMSWKSAPSSRSLARSSTSMSQSLCLSERTAGPPPSRCTSVSTGTSSGAATPMASGLRSSPASTRTNSQPSSKSFSNTGATPSAQRLVLLGGIRSGQAIQKPHLQPVGGEAQPRGSVAPRWPGWQITALRRRSCTTSARGRSSKRLRVTRRLAWPPPQSMA